MARVDGVHGPEKKPQVQFINEWSELKAAVGELRRVLDPPGSDGQSTFRLDRATVTALAFEVPRLMDAYAELWELMEGLIKAREQLEASKNDLYVPDAAEMVQGAIANPERTQR
jgi:hypothetical protein